MIRALQFHSVVRSADLLTAGLLSSTDPSSSGPISTGPFSTGLRSRILAGFIGCVALVTASVGHSEMPDFASPAVELTSSQTAEAEPVWHETLESGWEASKKSGRPMLIFITSEQCTYCDAMKRNTLCDPSVRKRLLGRFIPIRLRPDANNQVLSRVEVTAFPTTLVAQPQGKVVAHRVGYQPVEKFHELLSEVAVADSSVPDVTGLIR